MTIQLYDPFPGVQLWVDATTTDAGRLMSLGQYEWRKAGYIREHLKPGMIFVDVGAHIGYFTMLAASLVGESGRVVAWEPHRANADMIWMNIEANHFEQVITYVMAAGYVAERRPFYQGPSSGQHSLYRHSDQTCMVNVVPLDTVNYAHIDMMKIDVEAAELEVLQGATETLKHTDHILLDLHPELGADPAPVQALLHSAGFKLFDIRSDFAPLTTIPPTLVELLAVRA